MIYKDEYTNPLDPPHVTRGHMLTILMNIDSAL